MPKKPSLKPSSSITSRILSTVLDALALTASSLVSNNVSTYLFVLGSQPQTVGFFVNSSTSLCSNSARLASIFTLSKYLGKKFSLKPLSTAVPSR